MSLQIIFGVSVDRFRNTSQQVNPLKLRCLCYKLCRKIFQLTRSIGNYRGEQTVVVLNYLFKKSCTILAPHKQFVEQVLARPVFASLVGLDGADLTGAGTASLLLSMSSYPVIGRVSAHKYFEQQTRRGHNITGAPELNLSVDTGYLRLPVPNTNQLV